VIVAAVGVVSLAIIVRSVPDGGLGDVTLFSSVFFQILLSLALIMAGGWVVRIGLDDDENRRLVVWIVGGGVFAGAFVYSVEVLTGTDSGAVTGTTSVLVLPPVAGVVIGLLLGLYDVAQFQEREQLEVQRERATRRLERIAVLNRVLRHDIRNDVNVILGYIQQAQSGEDVEAALSVAERRAEKIQNLSKQSRDIEQLIRSDRSERERIDLVRVVDERVAEIRSEYVGVDVTVSAPETATVMVSPLIESAVDNVLENAIEHTDQAVAEIGVTITASDREGQAHAVRFADNGPGIPESERRVLEHGLETDLHHSSGLGLWIIYWIVRESGGVVEIADNDPRGTVVAFHLLDDRTPSTDG
jgi:signal transduction histidine kinase